MSVIAGAAELTETSPTAANAASTITITAATDTVTNSEIKPLSPNRSANKYNSYVHSATLRHPGMDTKDPTVQTSQSLDTQSTVRTANYQLSSHLQPGGASTLHQSIRSLNTSAPDSCTTDDTPVTVIVSSTPTYHHPSSHHQVTDITFLYCLI